jgi:hypothetical protein
MKARLRDTFSSELTKSLMFPVLVNPPSVRAARGLTRTIPLHVLHSEVSCSTIYALRARLRRATMWRLLTSEVLTLWELLFVLIGL